jgi:hypothetical protein
MAASLEGGLFCEVGWVSCFELGDEDTSGNGRGDMRHDTRPFHAQSVFKHFDTTHQVEFYIFERTPLSLKQSNACLQVEY